ncbi:MAG: hypothetical protein VYD19_07075, partial [Myxococcota bacterium]|nr:hypothetical protein [Myxococcota bacterium]
MPGRNRVKSISLLLSVGLLSACMDVSTVQLADREARGSGLSDRGQIRSDRSLSVDQYEPVELNGFAEPCARPGDCESDLCFAPDINALGLCTVACDQLGGVCPDERWLCQLV